MTIFSKNEKRHVTSLLASESRTKLKGKVPKFLSVKNQPRKTPNKISRKWSTYRPLRIRVESGLR